MVLAGSNEVLVRWQVYARELSVRTAYATADFAFWSGGNVLLWPVGGTDLPAEIVVGLPAAWSLAAGSAPVSTSDDGREARFSVRDQDQAVDTPCLAGRLEEFEVAVAGRSHRFVEVGRAGLAPPQSYREDLTAVLRASAAVFGGEPPFARFTFLTLFGERGRGGLEHMDSAALVAPRTTFAPRSSYEDYLALVAHEYLHAWNVKRMRPREFEGYDLECENHTELLWVAEGFTAYLDDLLCLRAGVTTPARYLARLASHVDAMLVNPGRFRQSLAEASFDAWLLLYRPDESTRNATQNYYTNGALAAFVIDAAIREHSSGRHTLDDALRILWRDTYAVGRGYDHRDVCSAISAAAGTKLDDFVDGLTRGPFDPDLTSALGLFGLRLELVDDDTPRLGVRFDAQHTTIAAVQDGTPAERGGLCPGDEILAIDRLRVRPETFASIWTACAGAGRAVRVLLAREGLLREHDVVPDHPTSGKARITSVAEPNESQCAHRRAWLGAMPLGNSTASDD
ncbi:MAG: M61 family metallopeptidase [Planctomycetes bacterium]|nr:M61 family metallopeptidase [Planctomycetota bacterium]